MALLGDGAGGGGAAGVEPGDLEAVADETLNASMDGLARAKNDPGIGYCVYLLAQVTRAAAGEDFSAGLDQAGVRPARPAVGLPDAPLRPAPGGASYTIFRLTSAFTAAVDGYLRAIRGRTDLGELAQLAAAETLTALAAASETLFGSTEETVRSALARLASRSGFGRLAHDFFARLVRRYIEYHLSRELSNHVGGGRRFANVDEHNDFLAQLDRHCRVATGPLRKFAADWYSLHDFRGDLTLEKARGFAAHALDKVYEALCYMEGRHVG